MLGTVGSASPHHLHMISTGGFLIIFLFFLFFLFFLWLFFCWRWFFDRWFFDRWFFDRWFFDRWFFDRWFFDRWFFDRWFFDSNLYTIRCTLTARVCDRKTYTITACFIKCVLYILIFLVVFLFGAITKVPANDIWLCTTCYVGFKFKGSWCSIFCVTCNDFNSERFFGLCSCCCCCN